MSSIAAPARVTGAGPWLKRLGPVRDGLLQLFCLPCAGHGASMFSAWPSRLPRTIELWAIQPPGREERLHEAPFSDAPSLVRATLDALRLRLDTRPFALVGHSMGALLAFELTRALRARGDRLPARLIVSGQSAPQTPRIRRLRHDLPDAGFVDALEEMNGARAGDDEYRDALRFMLPTLRADFQLCERYAYVDQPPLACDLTVWGGDTDPEARLASLVSWRDQTAGHFSFRMFPGDHFFLVSQRAAVLRALAETLEPIVLQTGPGRFSWRQNPACTTP